MHNFYFFFKKTSSNVSFICLGNDVPTIRFYLKDLRSSNGTFLCGRRLPSDQRVELRGGERVQFGQDVFDHMERHVCIVAKISLV